MAKQCNDIKKFKTAEASTKAWFRTRNLLDRFNNIPNTMLPKFREENSKLSKIANERGIEGRLFAEEGGGIKALPNVEMFHRIDAFNGVFYPDNFYLRPDYLPKTARPEYETVAVNEEETSKERASIVFDTLGQKFTKAFGIPYEMVTEDQATTILENSQTPYGDQAGFFYGDKVYFVSGKADMNTMVHEFAHPLIKAIAINNPKLFNNLYKKLLETSTGQDIIAQLNAEGKLDPSTDRFKEEALVRAMEKDANTKLAKITESDSAFKEFINMIMLAIKKIMASMTKLVRAEKLKTTTTLNELTDMMLFEDFEMAAIRFDNTDFADFASEFDVLLGGLDNVSAKQLQDAINRTYVESRYQLLQLRNSPWKLKEELAGPGGEKILRNIRDFLKRYQTVNLDPNSLSPEEILDAMESQQEEFRVRGIALINSINEAKVFGERIEDILEDMEKTKRHLTGPGIAKVAYFSDYITRQQEFLRDLENIIGQNRNNEFTKEIRNTINILNDAADKIKKLKYEAVLEIFVDNTEFMQEEMDNKLKERVTQIGKADNLSEAQINELIDQIISNPIGKSFKVDLNKYPINAKRANVLLADVQEYYVKRLNREAIEKYLNGETEDIGFFQAWLNPYLSMDDPIGSFARYMKAKLSDAEQKSLTQGNDIANRLLPLLQNVGYNPNNTGELGKMLLQTDKVGYTNANGEFEEMELYTFSNRFINWRRDKAELQHNLEKALEGANKDEIRTALQAVWEFEEKYMHRKYKQEYYDLQKIWKQRNVVRNPINGEDIEVSAELSADAFLERQAALDKMNQYRFEAYTEMTDLYEFTESDATKAEYEQLFQVTNADGSNKTGDDLLKALVRRKYRADSKKFYEYPLNEDRVQRDFANYIQELAARGITRDGLTADQWKAEMKKFINKNFRIAYSDEFYREKERLFSDLRAITEKYKSPLAERMTDLYMERWRLSTAITDKNGTTNALQYTNGMLEKMKELENEIVEIQDKFDIGLGLSKADDTALKTFDARLAGGEVLSADEQTEYGRIISQKNNLGMPPAILKKYKQILGEISGLTSKVPTEYYMAAFYEAIGDTQVSENISSENADSWINSEDCYNALATNDKFREWFLRNHFKRLSYDAATKSMQMKYFRTKAWTDTIPSDNKHYKITMLTDPITKIEIPIMGVPSGKYHTQRLKKEWRTGYDSTTGKINLKVGVEVDNKGNFLPRADAADKKYINKEYEDLERLDNAQFKLLEAMKEEYLKVQDKRPGSSKLYLDLARFRQRSNMEYVQSGKAKEDFGSKISTVTDLVKSAFQKRADDAETTPGFNVDTEAILIETDLVGQPITRIPVRGLYKLDIKEVSTDILPSFYTYLHSLNEQDALIKEEPIAKAIKEVFNDPDNAIKKMDVASKTIQRNTGKWALIKSDTNRRAKAINYFIDKTFYGQQYSSFEQDNPLMTKIANGLMKRASRSFIALDMVSALKNRFGMDFQNMIEAAAGQYYNPMAYAKGKAWAFQAVVEMQRDIYSKGPKGLKMQMMERFSPIPDKTKKDFGKSTSRTFIKDFFDASWMYDPRRFIEVEAALEVFGGMMYFQKVEQIQSDGTPKQIDYIDAFELDPDTKQIRLKPGIDPEWGFEPIDHDFATGDTFESLAKQYGVTVDELKAKNKINTLKDFQPGDNVTISKATKFTNFKMKSQGVQKRLNGGFEELDSPQAEQFLGYRLFTFYKKYATQMFLNRFQADMSKKNRWGHVYNWDLGTTTRGYYITGVLGAIKFLKMGTAYMPIMTAEEKAAFKKITTEGIGLMLLALAVSLLFGYDPGDEDRFEKMRQREEEFGALGWTANHMLYQLITVKRENMAFISPQEWLQYGDTTSIVFGPTVKVYMKILQDFYYITTGDEKALYKSDVGPYSWQQKDEDGTFDYKLWNHLLGLYGIKGKNYSPIHAIKTNEQFENLR